MDYPKKISPSRSINPSSASKENQSKDLRALASTKLVKPKPKPLNLSKQKSPFQSPSPPKNLKLELSQCKFEQSVQTPPNISLDSSRRFSEQSEIQGFSQHIYASSPDKQYPYYSAYNYQPDPYKDPAADKLKEDYEKMRVEFVQIMNEKEAELNRLRKDWESSKLDVMELEDKLRECGGGDYQMLEKRINVLLEQNQKLLEANRNISAEAKARYLEMESEIRMFKQRNEELIKDLMREKEKCEMMEVRMETIKERAIVVENTNLQSQERILELERELDSVYFELTQLKKRAIADRGEYYENSSNSTRNFNSEYTSRQRFQESNEEGTGIYTSRPRYQEPAEETALTYRNTRNASAFQYEPTQNRLRNNQEKSPFQRQSLEQKLESLLNDKQKLEKEYAKIPDICKSVSSKRRKEELELELEILDTNVHFLRSKIRSRPRPL